MNANYFLVSADFNGSPTGEYGFIVLGACDLGEVLPNYARRWSERRTTSDPDGEPEFNHFPVPRRYDSTKSEGVFRRKPYPRAGGDRIIWPTTDFIKVQSATPVCRRNRYPNSDPLKYSEHAVFDPRRVIIRYLVRFLINRKRSHNEIS